MVPELAVPGGFRSSLRVITGFGSACLDFLVPANTCGSRPGQPARPQDRKTGQFARAGTPPARGPLRRPANRPAAPANPDISARLAATMAQRCCPAGAGNRIDGTSFAAATTSMGHRCGCPAWRSSIGVPSLRLRPRAGGQSAGVPGAGDLNGGHREPGAEEPGTGSPGSALSSVSKWIPALEYQCYLSRRPTGGPATDAGTSLR